MQVRQIFSRLGYMHSLLKLLVTYLRGSLLSKEEGCLEYGTLEV